MWKVVPATNRRRQYRGLHHRQYRSRHTHEVLSHPWDSLGPEGPLNQKIHRATNAARDSIDNGSAGRPVVILA